MSPHLPVPAASVPGAVVRPMDAAVWTAIGPLAPFSTRPDGVNARIDAHLDRHAARSAHGRRPPLTVRC
ncbi:MAG TPA: hypothetical protein VFQ40_02320 [Actinomycetota bacterium]|nr:hypothetical protein [Actinomycetota bacterium]